MLRFAGALLRGTLLSVLLLSTMFVMSQESSPAGKCTIDGTVTDPSQAVVSGAAVTLSSAAGAKLETKTDEKGHYIFSGVEAGTYTLRINAANFAEKTQDYITLSADSPLTLDFSLELASAQSKVEVQENGAGQVETETATVSGTIAETALKTYGLNGRNFTQLMILAPGVSNQTGQDEAKVGVQGSVKFSVNGGRVEYNTFEVDGSDVLNTGLNGASSTLMVYPSLDAIGEMKVLTSNYGAQYGRTASGTIQVTTKSGTNKLHGSIYDFVRNEVFNARNYFDVTPKAPLYRRQDFGGTIGGPVVIPHVYNGKDKTFFFFSEEARLEKTPTAYNQAVPSLKERGLIMGSNGIQKNLVTAGNGAVYQAFDFSDVCPAIGTLSSAGTFNRQQYPDCPSFSVGSDGNPKPPGSAGTPTQDYLPAGLVSKNAMAILNSALIPLPNSSSGCNYSLPGYDPTNPNPGKLDPSDPNHCYVTDVSPSTYWREELFRIDHNITANMKLSFRYIHDAWNTTVLTPQWGVVQNTFPSVENDFVGPGTSLVARTTNIISASMVNDAVFSYSDSNITLTNQSGPGNPTPEWQLNASLYQPLVTDPSNPGVCNPTLSADPASGMPQCGMGYIFNNGFGNKMPGIVIGGTNAAYGGRGFAVDPSYMPWSHTNPTYSVRDDISKSVGKHTLQFGAQFVYAQRNQTNNAIGAASGDTQGLLTFSNLANSTGNAFADFLMGQQGVGSAQQGGYIQSYTQDSTQSRYYQRYEIAEPYFQDNWKVTPRLTLNLGLRISLFGTYSEKNHNVWNWDPSKFNPNAFAVDPNFGEMIDRSTGSPVLFNATNFGLDPTVVKNLGLVQCGVNGVPSGCMTGHLFNPAPRVGFAFDPKGDGRTSIRAGYGIFFEHGTGNEANTGSLEASSPVVLSMTQPNPLNYNCIGNIGFGGGNNSECVDPANNAAAPPANSMYPLNVTSIPTKAVWPYAQQWSLGVQRELRPSLVADIAYVGSKGTHLTVERNLNQAIPLPSSENPFGPNEPLFVSECTNAGQDGVNPGVFVLQGSGTVITPQSPAYVYMEAACAGTPGLPNVNSLPNRPYPGLGKIFALQNVANSSYNALQFRLQKTRGALTGGVSYAYSHSIDDSSDRSDPVMVNSYDLASNRASSDFDQRNSLTINYVYQVPNLEGLVKKLRAPVLSDEDDPANPAPTAPEDVTVGKWSKILLSDWQLSGVTVLQSGTPYTVINSAGNTGISLMDNAGVNSGIGIAESYPDVVHGVYTQQPANNPQSFGPLLGNPNQFVAPRGLTFGDAGRNYLNNPGRFNNDIAFLKNFKVKESVTIEFRAEIFNLFNTTQFRVYDPNNPGTSGYNVISCYAGPAYSAGYQAAGGPDCVTGASFLHPVDAHRPRTMQFALKLAF
jgi:Carboxypeptidase regulatory-like domain